MALECTHGLPQTLADRVRDPNDSSLGGSSKIESGERFEFPITKWVGKLTFNERFEPRRCQIRAEF